MQNSFGIFQHPFMIKTHNKLVIEEKYLKTVKIIYVKPAAYYYAHWSKSKLFLQNQEKDINNFSHHFYLTYWKQEERSWKQEEETKDIQIVN